MKLNLGEWVPLDEENATALVDEFANQLAAEAPVPEDDGETGEKADAGRVAHKAHDADHDDRGA